MTSWLERFAQDRDKLARARKPLALTVAGWVERDLPPLVVRYNAPSADQLAEMVKEAQQIEDDDAEADTAAQADMLRDCCEGLYVKGRDGLEALGSNGKPVRFEKDLADALGLSVSSQRETVLAVFFHNPLAVGDHFTRLFQWAQGEAREVDERVVGESVGRTPPK